MGDVTAASPVFLRQYTPVKILDKYMNMCYNMYIGLWVLIGGEQRMPSKTAVQERMRRSLCSVKG